VLGVSIVLFVVLLAVLFAVAAVTAGFGDLMKPVFQDARPVGMPDAAVTPEDLDALRFNVVLRGYKMAEVDAVLHRLSRELGERDAVLAELRGDASFRRPVAYEPADAPTELIAPVVVDDQPTELMAPVVVDDQPTEQLASEPDVDPQDPGLSGSADLDETQGFPVYEAPPQAPETPPSPLD
jgi:DivIVA domain-containing protein